MLASVLQAASPQNGAGHFICHSCPRHQNQHVQTSVCDFLIYLPTDAACDGCKTLILRVWRHCGQGDAETLRTFTFDGDSACFMSSALYSSLGLGSLEMTYVGDARCPCE